MFTHSSKVNLELGAIIVQKVGEVSIFGSTNKKPVLEANTKFLKLLKAFTFILQGTHPAITKKLGELAKNDPTLYEFYLKLKETTKFYQVSAQEVGIVFKKGECIASISEADLVNPNSYRLLTWFYPPKYFDWKEEDVETIIACLAEYLAQLRVYQEIAKSISNEKLLRELQFCQYYNMGLEPRECSARERFLEKTLDDIKNIAIIFGFANCAMMADIAFLETLSMNIPHQITYIRFVSTNTNLEELNAVVIGDWPKPGCLIISPWQDEPNRYYYWNGSIEATPGVVTEGAYNQVKVIFTLKPDTSEAKRFHEVLTRTEYSNWLTSDNRKNGIEAVRNFKEKFKSVLRESSYFSAKLVQTESECSGTPTKVGNVNI